MPQTIGASRRWSPGRLGSMLLLMSFCSCAVLQELTQTQKPTLQVQAVRITRLSLAGVDLVCQLSVKNPNAAAITMAGFDYALKLNTVPFVQGQQTNKIVVAAQGQSVVEIPIQLGFNELYQTFQSLQNQDEAAYELMVGLTFDLPVLGPTRLPLQTSGTIPLLKAPGIRIQSLKMERLTLLRADLNLSVQVANPNAFPFELLRFDYQFAVNKLTWIAGAATEPLVLPEKNYGTLIIPISLDFIRMGQTVYQIVRGDRELDYRLGGSLDLRSELPLLGTVHLPVERTGQIKITR